MRFVMIVHECASHSSAVSSRHFSSPPHYKYFKMNHRLALKCNSQLTPTMHIQGTLPEDLGKLGSKLILEEIK